MKKHDNSEGLLRVEAGLSGVKEEGKKSSSCSAGLLLAIIIAILLLLSLVISSLFWAVYAKLTNEQLKIFDSTAVSDLEPLESNDVFVDSLLLRLAAQQNETDRSIPTSLGTRKNKETETEVRVEPILSVPDEPELFEPLATPLHSTTGTTETSHEFPEKSSDEESTGIGDPEPTTRRYEDAEKFELDVFNFITDDTGALKVNVWLREPVEDEASSSSLMTSVLNLLNGKLATDEKHYHPTVSPEGSDVNVERNTDLFPDDENSTVNLDVDWDEQDSETSFENLWDWLGSSYTSRSRELTIEQETEEEEHDDEYFYDDLDYLDYYGNLESYEDTTDENQVIESNRWNDLVDALSVLRIEFLSKYKDELFSTEDTASSIPNVLHDLRNYTDTLARGMSDVIASFWNDLPPDAFENGDIEVAATDSHETKVPEITSSTEISSTMSSADVEEIGNTGTEMEITSGTSEAPVLFDDEGIRDATTESYDYYWYPDDDELEKVIDDLLSTNDPYISESYLADFPGLRQRANSGTTTKATKSDEEESRLTSFGNSEEYDDELSDFAIFGKGDETELPQSDGSEKANADFSGETEASMLPNEELEGSEIDRRAVEKMADMLVYRNVLLARAPRDSNEEPYLLAEIDAMLETIDDDDVRSMKMVDELLATMSDTKYNMDKVLLDEIAVRRYYLRLVSRFDFSSSDDSSSSIIPIVFSESTDSQKLAGIRSIAKRDVVRRRNELPPRLLRKKTPSEVFARTRRVRQIEENEDIATSFVGMRRDLLKETRDFYSKMDRLASHIDGLQDRFYRRNKLDDDYVSKEMPDDEEDPRNL